MDKFVIDAGPFIHLDQIGQLRLLKKLHRIFIPVSVSLEIKQGTSSTNLRAVKRWPNVEVISVRRRSVSIVDAIVDRAPLQRGEIDCIYLVQELHPCIFLTDDLSARITAEKLHMEVHGTVGVIAYSVRHRWLSIQSAEEVLDSLYHKSNLFITYAIIEEAIRRLKEPT